MKPAPALLLIFLFTLQAYTCDAQNDFEKYKQQQQGEYNQFRQNGNRQFIRYRDSLNQVYKQYRDSCSQALKRFRDSLNIEFGRQLKQKWQKSKTLPPKQPDSFRYSNAYPQGQFSPPSSPTPLVPAKTFYGISLEFDIPQQTVFQLKQLTEETVANAWLHLNQCELNDLIINCQLITKDMQLNGWGYYQLICWLSGKIFPTDALNEKIIFHFFMLTQSGYKCKIGYTEDNNLTLLLPFNASVFFRNYQEYDGVPYYIIEKRSANDTVSAYSFDFPESSRLTDIYLHQSPRFGNDAIQYKEFQCPESPHQIKLPINKHLIDFYATYPFCQLSVYNQTSPSPQLVRAIRKEFASLLNVTDSTEKISRLLKFTHTAFRYKPDEECWGQERYFFPEESLFHPYMDCEDYAILFCFLNRILTGYPSLLVAYPGHIASAVRIHQNIKKGYILHKNKKYTLCDPTYKGSVPGEVVPAVSKARHKVIE